MCIKFVTHSNVQIKLDTQIAYHIFYLAEFCCTQGLKYKVKCLPSHDQLEKLAWPKIFDRKYWDENAKKTLPFEN